MNEPMHPHSATTPPDQPPERPWTRLADRLVVPLGAALIASLAVDHFGLGETLGKIGSLEVTDLLWLTLGVGFVFVLGARHGERAMGSGTAGGPSVEPPPPDDAANARAYADVVEHAVAQQNLLLAVRYGLVWARAADSIEGLEYCLIVPAELMSKQLGTKIRLSLWSSEQGQFCQLHAPDHPPEHRALSVAPEHSQIVAQTDGWREGPTPTSYKLKLDPQEHLPVIVIDNLTGYVGQTNAQDYSMLATLGYRSACWVPVNIGTDELWLVAVSQERESFTDLDERHMRHISINIQLSQWRRERHLPEFVGRKRKERR